MVLDLEGTVSDCPSIQGIGAGWAEVQHLAVVHERTLHVQWHRDQHRDHVREANCWACGSDSSSIQQQRAALPSTFSAAQISE